MRVLVVSDIHGNLAALKAVVRDAEERGPIDAAWNMGDAVGYGPQPSQCVSTLISLDAAWVAGNHERAATGAIGTEDFNAVAAAAADWTREALSDDEKSFLDDLPEVRTEGEAVLVHGSLRWPIWEYLLDGESARAHLGLMQVRLSFVGHTHLPMVIFEDGESPEGCRMQRLTDGATLQMDPATRTVINPGSVGQPRDGDSRASYGIYDDGDARFTLHRVEYDIAATQSLMTEAGLPEWLAERLEIGR